jgi:hypothetical protein
MSLERITGSEPLSQRGTRWGMDHPEKVHTVAPKYFDPQNAPDILHVLIGTFACADSISRAQHTLYTGRGRRADATLKTERLNSVCTAHFIPR